MGQTARTTNRLTARESAGAPIPESREPRQRNGLYCYRAKAKRIQAVEKAVLRDNANPDKVILAIAKAIRAKFDRGRWLELALLTNSTELVQGHRRLLRSLDWGDEDYFGNVIEVLPGVLGDRPRMPTPFADTAKSRFPHFKTVEEFIGLPGWLRDHEPELYAELYGDSAGRGRG